MYRNFLRPRFNKGNTHFGGSRGGYRGGKNYGGGGHKIPIDSYIKESVPVLAATIEKPTALFSELPLNDKIQKIIADRGYTNPTPIQTQIIPHIIAGRDVIGIANTGTGKTGAFLLPLIEKIFKNPYETTLIIIPTRELALQIQEELRLFTPGMPIYSVLCMGGASLGSQISQLKRNPHFIIGTPGRLKDLITRKALNMSVFNTIVLDEVDRMVDMGFIQDIKALIAMLPKKRQSLFFSATIPSNVQSIVHSFLDNPVTVSVVTRETAGNVEQNIIRVQGGEKKFDLLTGLLAKENFKKVLIFVRTKNSAERLSVDLISKSFKAVSIHGDKPQNKRNQAMRMFKANEVSIMVATDVAARGIDVPDITHVINYDEPATKEDYVHRVGRTGRGNQKGWALTFV